MVKDLALVADVDVIVTVKLIQAVVHSSHLVAERFTRDDFRMIHTLRLPAAVFVPFRLLTILPAVRIPWCSHYASYLTIRVPNARSNAINALELGLS